MAPGEGRRARGARRVHAPPPARVLRDVRRTRREHALRPAARVPGRAPDRGRPRGGRPRDRGDGALGRRGRRHRPGDPRGARARRGGRHARDASRPRPGGRAPSPARRRPGAPRSVTIRRALLSVYDKTGIAAFARELHGLGVELLASGGTARALADERIPVTPLESLTGFGELLGHRVVTLHPAVHAGILARRDVPADLAELEAHGIAPIDLVCVNLYPFERTVGRLDVSFEEAIEQIVVGGPAMLRAAAKNHDHVVPVCRPVDYEPVLEEFRTRAEVSPETRRALATRAFETTAAYD